MKSELYKFQREDARRIHQSFDGICLLGSEVGLGKTITAFYYAWRYLPADPSGPIVIVVPAHLKLHWKREAQKHLGLRVEVLYGQRCPPEKQAPMNPNQVYVINYEILVPPRWGRGGRIPHDSWLYFLMNQRPRLIIADEAHKLSNPRTAQTRAVRRIARITPRRLLLTGTPISNKPISIWSLLNILHPESYPSMHDFGTEYTHARFTFGHWQYEGAKNLDLLNIRLQEQCLIRRRKVDVLDQLPQISYSVIPVEIDYEEYNNAEKDYIGWLAQRSPLQAASAAKAEELSRLNGLKQLAGILKADAVIEWIKSFLESGRKLLLGAIHHAVTERIIAAFPKRMVALVDGTISGTEKDYLTQRFNRDPDCKLLVGNIQAAGTGWSCRSTSDLALCEIPWVPGDVAQFTGRIHGLERGIPGTAAQVRFLVAPDTIEEDLCKLIDTKQRWSELAIDGRYAEQATTEVYKLAKAAILQRAGRER